MASTQANRTKARTNRRIAETVRGSNASPRRCSKFPGNSSSTICEAPATIEAASPIWPLVIPATSRLPTESLRSTVGEGSSWRTSPTSPDARRVRVSSSRRIRASFRERAGSEISGSSPPPAASTRTSTTPKRRCAIPCTVFTLWMRSSGSERSLFCKTPRLRWNAPPDTRYVVARQESAPHTALKTQISTAISRTRIRVRIPNWPLIRAAIPGNAAAPIQRRIVPSAASNIPTGWRRRSPKSSTALEFIRRSGELGDPVTHLGGRVFGKLWDLVRSGGSIEDHRREPQAPLQRSASGIYVLHPRHRHQRPRDTYKSPLQVHL